MTDGSIIATVFSYMLLLTTVLLSVISGIGFQYFSKSLILADVRVNIRILFGCGIGIGIIVFFMAWIYLAWPFFFCNWFFTFPIMILIISLFLLMTLPSEKDAYVRQIGKAWSSANEFVIKKIQYEYECCGWSNFSDHGISPCPVYFESGCMKLMERYLAPRFSEIFISSLLMLLFLVSSVLILTLYSYLTDSTSILENVYLLNEIFTTSDI